LRAVAFALTIWMSGAFSLHVAAALRASRRAPAMDSGVVHR